MLRRRSLLVLSLLILGGLLPFTAFAAYTDNPPAQTGFVHAPKLSADDTGHGILLAGSAIGYSSPTIAEIDPDVSGKEVTVGGKDGLLYVYNKDGSLNWQVNVLTGLVASCNYQAFDGLINSSPAVGDLEGDGTPEVVVGYGTIHQTNCPGGVAAYDGRTGAIKWRYQLTNGSERLHGVLSSPALADVDGDGTLEVGFGNFERDIVVLTSTGVKRWRYHNADTVWSSPAFADADGDGLPDLIIGSDISENTRVNPPLQNGGYITAFRGTDSTIIWRKFYNMTIWSSPAIADLNGDSTQEVIIGAGCYDNFNPAVNGHWVKILDIRTGNEIRTLNASGCVASAIAVADLDGNGKLDIVAGVDGRHNSPVTPGRVQAWEYDNSTPKWTATPGQAVLGVNDPDIGNLKSPVIADIDGNGSPEVLIANQSDLVVLNGVSGAQLTCNNCNAAPTKTLYAAYPLISTAAVGDMDGNGKLEVVIGGSHLYSPGGAGARGFLYAWTDISGLGSPSSNATPYNTPWPMFRRSGSHIGVMPELLRSPSNITVLSEEGGSARTVFARLRDAAGETIAWNASDDKDWLDISPGNGTAPNTLTITVDPSGKNAGFDETGTISISSASGSPTIAVRLLVVDTLYTTYLPSVSR